MPQKPNTPRDVKAVSKPKPADDVAIVLGSTEEGGVNILRKRADRLEAGTLKPLQEGVPIHGEVVQLHPRKGSPVCDVQVHVPRSTAAASAEHDGAGPAQVATDSYRKNWDHIYRRRGRASKELN